ncbi:MAG: hypothetical protein EOQ39_01920 [Mesorhizobium sp.]|uniref:hypothetical protein n=1 Tax=Mesorhizobium sp. TaxID=1871066 RepID=UPI000FE81690|nr:hypothetical protein [Mesorhizobium sp.]RWB04601.1 MAG: hypothetical protein EOQ37_17825 [Mesorhizobium sp.]RWB18305.1 MAG: hypothetical protein EOQ39_01920 [Mesorhizobium sp.]
MTVDAAAASGGQFGILAENNGAGATTITATGMVEGGDAAIKAMSSAAQAISITTSGLVRPPVVEVPVRARMPAPSAPVTKPVAMTLVAPVPKLKAARPVLSPLTPTASTVRSVPQLATSMPGPVSPVTAPVAVMLVAPVPKFRA